MPMVSTFPAMDYGRVDDEATSPVSFFELIFIRAAADAEFLLSTFFTRYCFGF